MKLTNLASLDDSIDRAGLTNVSKADRDIWAEMQQDWSGAAEAIVEAQERFGIAAEHEIDAEAADGPMLVGEDALAMTKRRRGQDFFRRIVLSSYGFRCCISGLSDRRLLVASHIVPWRDQDKQAIRLDPRNGLCLSVIHDEAFDRGLITLDSDFRVVLSPQLDANDDAFIEVVFRAYAGKPITLPTKFAPNPELLAYHREYTFLASAT